MNRTGTALLEFDPDLNKLRRDKKLWDGLSAVVQIGDSEHVTRPGEYRYIPLGEKHRLSNRTNQIVELVEVQIGEYLGEDDIVRLVDNYGRA